MTHIDISDTARFFLALVSFGFFLLAGNVNFKTSSDSKITYVVGLIGFVVLTVLFSVVSAAFALIAAVGKMPWP
jgi:hypothetical protein